MHIRTIYNARVRTNKHITILFIMSIQTRHLNNTHFSITKFDRLAPPSSIEIFHDKVTRSAKTLETIQGPSGMPGASSTLHFTDNDTDPQQFSAEI